MDANAWSLVGALIAAGAVMAGGEARQVALGKNPIDAGVHEQAACAAREAELLRRIDVLESELARLTARASEQESEWMKWIRLLDDIGPDSLPAPPAFLQAALPDPPSDTERALADADLARAQRALADLRALLLAEELNELDVLAIGRVHGETGDGFLGPVVVRLLDKELRPSGTLAAERLRLECSRTGWGVTLVFEEGLEHWAGRAEPFGPPSTSDGERGGVRRIHLPGVDPAPWIAAFPELLGAVERSLVHDDGLWDLLRVRQEINRLLAADRRTGSWRLVALGGVAGDALQAVHVVELDDSDHVERRLFADRLRIVERGEAIELELSDGVHERADRRAPFLDQRYRIFLTGSSAAAWKLARLPGISAPDRTPLPEDLRAVDQLP